jgi:hypothetical protein
MFDSFFFNSNSAPICKIGDKNIAMILKNGTSSLKKLAGDNGYEITSVRADFDMGRTEDYFIDVYIRNPVDRYFSALDTVNRMYKLPVDTPTMDQVEVDQQRNGFFIDTHFYPQYWYMIAAYIQSSNSDNLYFRFHDFADIGQILSTVKENANPDKDLKSASNRQIIKRRYIYDLAIFHQLTGKTLNYPELLEFYSHTVRGHPRLAEYILKTSPKHHDADTQKKVDHYNQALDKISQLAKNIKRY